MKAKQIMIQVLFHCSLLAGCVAAKPPPTTLPVTPTSTPLPTATTAAKPPQPVPTTLPAPDYWPTREWRSTTPETQGMDSTRLAEMLAYIQDHHIRLHSLLIVRNGYLVTEAYFNPYTADTPHQIQSVTKSVIGALIGIAIDQGHIRDVHQPVLEFFPDKTIANLDERKKAITVADLLTLTSGLDCQDFDASRPQMQQSPDWVQFVLDLPMAAVPGEQWRYCSAQAHLLSAILQQVTGMDARTYANANLFRPLGIAEVPPERWEADPQGVNTGGYGLLLTSRELAKFALLYLDQGQWDGKALLSPQYVSASITQQTLAQKRDYIAVPRGYGYLWSTFPQVGVTSALGLAGQHVHLVPELNLAVVFTAAIPQDGTEFDLLQDYIVPAVKSSTALPANPAGQKELLALIKTAANPVQPVDPLPPTAQAISDRVFVLKDNAMQWKTIRLTFSPHEAMGYLQVNDEPSYPFGLNNLYRLQPDGPLAARGHWENEAVLLLEAVMLGPGAEYTLRFRFDGDQLKLLVQDLAFWAPPVQITGSIQN